MDTGTQGGTSAVEVQERTRRKEISFCLVKVYQDKPFEFVFRPAGKAGRGLEGARG